MTGTTLDEALGGKLPELAPIGEERREGIRYVLGNIFELAEKGSNII
jgi:hypothetical protein